MSFLSKISLKNGFAVILLFVFILVYGGFSATTIKQQTFPDLEFPAVFIQAINQGASTEEMENEITNPIENSLKSFNDYDTLTSSTTESSASISIQFPFGTDMEKRTVEIEQALDKLHLSDKATISVQRLSIGAAPIYKAAVFSTDNDTEALANKLQNEIVPKLKSLDGVSSVNLKGLVSEELRVVVDKEKAAQKGITISAIQSALQSLNYGLSLGSVTQNDTTIPIRLSGKVTSITQLEQLRLGGASPQGGKLDPSIAKISEPTKLADIATITTISSQKEITRYNGEASYSVEVIKTQDANTPAVANEVKAVLASYQETNHFDVHVVMDQGQEIEKSISSLVKEGLFGALFCVIIIFLFLRNIRATVISLLSLPISIFATIAVMDQMGYTLNIMTLGGIAVSIGRIVDDSIVVIENIYRWRQENGDKLKGKALAYRATKEVISPVFSSTVATIVVFAPLAFVSGIIGEFFRPFSLAVVISIVTSLLVAVMLIPVLGSKFFNRVKPHKENNKLTNGFETLLRGALKRKALVLGLSILLLVGSLGTIPLLGLEFISAGSVPSATIVLTLPAKSSMEQTNVLTAKVESYVQGLNGIDKFEASLGGSSGNPLRGGSSSKNKATVSVQFIEGTNMDEMVTKLNTDLRPLVSAEVADAIVNVKEGEQQGIPSGDNIDVSLYANNVDDLSTAAKQIEDLMNQNSDLKNVTNNMNEVKSKWELTLNQKGIDANISPYQIMQTVHEQLRPVDAGIFNLDHEERSVSLAYKQQISSKKDLENIQIMTAGGVMKLKDVADITVRDALITVNHDDGKSYAKVSGTIKSTETAAVTRQVQKDIASLSLPSGVEVSYGGGLAMIKEGFTSMGIAMAAAVGLVFLVMSMTFGGLRTPFIILSSLIFIPVGSLTALLITGQSLSMSAMIGMLMLVGIVVTNAVVLLDRVENNRKSGMQITEAIVEASRIRLRPILMTACATILALVPLALSGSSTNLISGGLAITVIGGLFTSTVLTLVVVPVIYEMAWKKQKVKDIETF
ncbi:HAE1 family hydrophobic/amphiphilic exporter-1 [Paenibacillus castaneae]|uniref:efflux RND transporter permease subunit n=1 Tax=Paenibacillus castaneae TaxID=474957 RepID=UPI000C9BC43E|nr:efflux RND transporter permease subunit [Paenibacillus castaneae]NIK79549.1 HAE1 family hydrophobic/amphiphilic exporter-1 [Paenibacillus castaneae]